MSNPSRDCLLYLEDIINAIEKIENYTQNMDFHKFSKMKWSSMLLLEILKL